MPRPVGVQSLLDVGNDGCRFEADHHDPSVRRRRFADPPVWCVLVSAGPDEYVVRWEVNDDGDPVVIYIGGVPFV